MIRSICIYLLMLAPAVLFSADSGTEAMARRLASLHERVDPVQDIYSSDLRTIHFKEQMARSRSPDEFLNNWINYALELLNSARAEEAIEEWNKIIRFLKERDPERYAQQRRILGSQLAASHLLLGERQNCLLNHTSESCLLPIQGGGIHQLPAGSRGAIDVLTELLNQFPNDAGSRWLLNLAYMTLGEYPDSVPSHWRLDPAVFESDYDIGRFRDIASQLGIAGNDLSGGTILDDFNNDGRYDIMASSFRLDRQLKLYLNQGDGTFADHTESAGLKGITGGLNLIQADYDNDGDVDVLALRGGWLMRAGRIPNSLLRNNGDGTFSDVTREAGMYTHRPTQTAVWFDFDGDGWLDLFVGNESVGQERHRSELYRNNRDGTFTECAFDAGLRIYEFIKGVDAADYDNDGRPDLYLSILNGKNRLLRNEGPLDSGDSSTFWNFADMGEHAGVEMPFNSFPCWFFDYDNDGWEDLFVSSYDLVQFNEAVSELIGIPTEAQPMKLYRNRGDGTFEDRTRALGLETMNLAMGCNYGDLDNDGWLDFYLGTGNPDFRALVPNKMYRNAEGKVFQDVTTSGGFGHLQKGHGIGFADLDNDGDQDIYANMGGAYTGDVYPNALFENPGHGNRWIGLQLIGEQSNRSAIGARIRVEVAVGDGSRTIHRTVNSGGSFGASPLDQHIGLGQATAVEAIEVFWPATGEKQRIEGLEINRWHRIHEGKSETVALSRKAMQFQAGDSMDHTHSMDPGQSHPHPPEGTQHEAH